METESLEEQIDSSFLFLRKIGPERCRYLDVPDLSGHGGRGIARSRDSESPVRGIQARYPFVGMPAKPPFVLCDVPSGV